VLTSTAAGQFAVDGGVDGGGSGGGHRQIEINHVTNHWWRSSSVVEGPQGLHVQKCILENRFTTHYLVRAFVLKVPRSGDFLHLAGRGLSE